MVEKHHVAEVIEALQLLDIPADPVLLGITSHAFSPQDNLPIGKDFSRRSRSLTIAYCRCGLRTG